MPALYPESVCLDASISCEKFLRCGNINMIKVFTDILQLSRPTVDICHRTGACVSVSSMLATVNKREGQNIS